MLHLGRDSPIRQLNRIRIRILCDKVTQMALKLQEKISEIFGELGKYVLHAQGYVISSLPRA
jgi:hypothetical protein